MNILSLFDGKSSGYTAAELAGLKIDNYYSSEIDKYAIQVSEAIHPNQTRLGDVTKWREWDIDWSSIDLLIAGSPCQGFSFAGKQLAFDDPRSKLFFEFVDILNHIKALNPNVKFMLENVKMKKEYIEVIDKLLGVEAFPINSALVSAQNRQRLYWSNIPIDEPEDRGFVLADILEDLPDEPVGVSVREKSKCLRIGGRNSPFGSKQEWDSPFQRVSKKGKVKSNINKAGCLCGGANSGGNHSDMDIIHTPFTTRRYSVRECFRLQTMPEHLIDRAISCGVSNSQLYKIAGNGWTDEVIAHIFRGLNADC